MKDTQKLSLGQGTRRVMRLVTYLQWPIRYPRLRGRRTPGDGSPMSFGVGLSSVALVTGAKGETLSAEITGEQWLSRRTRLKGHASPGSRPDTQAESRKRLISEKTKSCATRTSTIRGAHRVPEVSRARSRVFQRSRDGSARE